MLTAAVTFGCVWTSYWCPGTGRPSVMNFPIFLHQYGSAIRVWWLLEVQKGSEEQEGWSR